TPIMGTRQEYTACQVPTPALVAVSQTPRSLDAELSRDENRCRASMARGEAIEPRPEERIASPRTTGQSVGEHHNEIKNDKPSCLRRTKPGRDRGRDAFVMDSTG